MTESCQTPKSLGHAQMSPRAVAYARRAAVDNQEFAADDQLEQIHAWATMNGIDIVQDFKEEGCPGMTLEQTI